MSIQDEIRLYLRARVALIVLVTVEERRAIEVLDEVRQGRDQGSDLVLWDIADRFESTAGRQLPDAADPVIALDKIKDMAFKTPARRDLYVLKDFHERRWKARPPRVIRPTRSATSSSSAAPA